MPAQKPEDADLMIAQAISAWDVDAAAAFYEPNAVFIPEPGKVITGLDGIRQMMTEFVAMKPTLTITVDNVARSGDLALLSSSWTLTGTGSDGSAVNMSGKGAEVVRRQADGTWLFVIDNPNGGG